MATNKRESDCRKWRSPKDTNHGSMSIVPFDFQIFMSTFAGLLGITSWANIALSWLLTLMEHTTRNRATLCREPLHHLSYQVPVLKVHNKKPSNSMQITPPSSFLSSTCSESTLSESTGMAELVECEEVWGQFVDVSDEPQRELSSSCTVGKTIPSYTKPARHPLTIMSSHAIMSTPTPIGCGRTKKERLSP